MRLLDEDGLVLHYRMDCTEGKDRDSFVAWIVAKDGDGRHFSRAIGFTGDEMRVSGEAGTPSLIRERILAAVADFGYPHGAVKWV